MPVLRSLTAIIGLCFLAITIAFPQKTDLLPAWANEYNSVRPSGILFIVAKGGKMGVVDAKGKALTRLEYDTIFNFREQMAIVGKGKREVNQFGKIFSDFKYGYINQLGKLIIPIKYDIVEDFSEGVAHVVPSIRQDIWFNKQGKPAIVLDHLGRATSFEGNMAYVVVGKIGFHIPPDYPGQPNPNDVRGNYIDHQGRLLVPWKYDTIAPYYPGFLRPVRKNGKWGFLDSSAKVVVSMHYDDIDQDSAYFWQNLRRVGLGKRYGFINQQTGQVVIPLLYEASKPSKSKYVWVQQRGYWGCINKEGKEVVPFRYDDARPFEDGLSVVQSREKWGLINIQGHLLTALSYDVIFPFHEGRAAVKDGDKFGFIDQQGQPIIPTVYDQISQFTNSQAYAKRWGLFITLAPDGHWLSVKLQTSTLKWLTLLGSLMLSISFLVWKQRQIYLRNST